MKLMQSKILSLSIGLSFVLVGCDNSNDSSFKESSSLTETVNFPVPLEELVEPFYSITLERKGANLPITGYYLNDDMNKRIILLGEETFVVNYIGNQWVYMENSNSIEGDINIAKVDVIENSAALLPGSNYFFGLEESDKTSSKVSFNYSVSKQINSFGDDCSLEATINAMDESLILSLRESNLVNCPSDVNLIDSFIFPVNNESPASAILIYSKGNSFKSSYIFSN